MHVSKFNTIKSKKYKFTILIIASQQNGEHAAQWQLLQVQTYSLHAEGPRVLRSSYSPCYLQEPIGATLLTEYKGSSQEQSGVA